MPLIKCGMPIEKHQVFVSSRFEEFHEVRRALKARLDRVKRPPVNAVDLNDNSSDTRPPLRRCYDAVDRADVFVLILGETYADDPKTDLSYSHLEYRRALTSRTRVILPFLIAGTGLHERGQTVQDPRLDDFVKEVRRKHCLSELDVRLGAERLASDMFEVVLERLWEIFEDETDHVELDEPAATGGATGIFQESPIKRSQLALSPMEENGEGGLSLLRRLANDHAREALKALSIGLAPLAVQHLRRSVELVRHKGIFGMLEITGEDTAAMSDEDLRTLWDVSAKQSCAAGTSSSFQSEIDCRQNGHSTVGSVHSWWL